jgi:hypothetical protein
LVVYFGVLKMHENEIPNDILLWNDILMPITNDTPLPAEELTTDNLWAVEASEHEVEKVEEQDEQNEQGVVTPWNKEEENTSSELISDNLDVTEGEQPTEEI